MSQGAAQLLLHTYPRSTEDTETVGGFQECTTKVCYGSRNVTARTYVHYDGTWTTSGE
jgi:hypothetical protein